MARHHVILIPGFFAFSGLGDLRYWSGVDAELERAFSEFGLDVDVIEIETLPTASIVFRAAKVVEAIAAVASRDDGPIHLIGHSTGGLDARVAITPHAALPTAVELDVQERVASIVTLATPHRGAPLASLFGSVLGQPLLRLWASSAILGLRRGKVPLSTLLQVGCWITRLDDLLGLDRTLMDQLYKQLLRGFDDQRREALVTFLDQVSHDRALIVQLAPDSLDLLNATTADPDGIAYGSVVTRARAPTARHLLAYYADPYAQGLHLLFSVFWLLSARLDRRYAPLLSDPQRRALVAGYGTLPGMRDNDGMVPTLAQVWGEVVHVAEADHLDVIGQYGEVEREGIHTDWLPSGSGFTGVQSRALWWDVAAFVTRCARAIPLR